MKYASGAINLFMTSFTRLKEKLRGCKNSDLVSLAASNEQFRDLCIEVYAKSDAIREMEAESQPRFFKDANPAFISEWRDYEKNYEKQLFIVSLINSDGKFVNSPHGFPSEDVSTLFDKVLADRFELDIERNILLAGTFTFYFSSEIQSIFESLYSESGETLDEFVSSLRQGPEHWEKFRNSTGFSLSDAMRRHLSVPFVHIPADVATKYRTNAILTLYTQLQQAHSAFVFGAHYAAIALMRSTMEMALRKHHHTYGKYVENLIDNCQSLPNRNFKDQLHELRELANAILHGNESKLELDSDIERKIASYFILLRNLIELAPSNKPANS